MNRLLVGCPVRDRAWILPAWFEHLDAAAVAADVALEFVFTGPKDDVDTWMAVMEGAAGSDVWVHFTDEPAGPPDNDGHAWDADSKLHMVGIRNQLLGAVRRLQPAMFLSIDSDVLIAHLALVSMIETLRRGYAAVGGGCYMSNGIGASSFYTVDGSRPDSPGMVRTDVGVIMALKLLTPDAYWVDYEYHHLGEDIGWSEAVRRHGGFLAWDNRYTSRHVMQRGEDWGRRDKRLAPRW